MKIEVDKNSGFCFGVVNAIETAEQELQQDALYCLGEIVHNEEEIGRLQKAGLDTISHEDFEDLEGKTVLIRAHGEPPSTYDLAREKGVKIIDATCPIVKKLQQRIKEAAQTGVQILIFGKKAHPEVVGLNGQTGNTAIVLESAADLAQLDLRQNLSLFSQTTKSVEEFEALVEEIIRRRKAEGLEANYSFVWKDSICRSVANRREKLIAFARKHDAIVFVSGKKSSNGKYLYGICKGANANSFFISGVAELKGIDFSAFGSVGICGATSTPTWLMEDVAKALGEL